MKYKWQEEVLPKSNCWLMDSSSTVKPCHYTNRILCYADVTWASWTSQSNGYWTVCSTDCFRLMTIKALPCWPFVKGNQPGESIQWMVHSLHKRPVMQKAPEAAIMTISGATNDDKVGIMATSISAMQSPGTEMTIYGVQHCHMNVHPGNFLDYYSTFTVKSILFISIKIFWQMIWLILIAGIKAMPGKGIKHQTIFPFPQSNSSCDGLKQIANYN